MGWYYSAKGGKCRAVIGKDTRLSSYMLEYALAAGITSSGGDAYIMHVTTTPSVSFVTRCDGFDCGVMISASHNPYHDNGIKLVNSRGEKMDRGVLNLIEDYIDDRLFIGGAPFKVPFVQGEKVGRTVDYIAGRNRYIGYLIALSTCSYKGLKVGLDCANGSGYKIARNVFEALGATLFVVGDEPNGVNVNDGCGSTDVSSLKRLVKEEGLDVAFAFDGDADRCICIDERGNVIDGDGIMYVAAKHLKSKGELLGDRIIATVMSNVGLKESLAREGIKVEDCRVGDSYVHSAMTERGAVLGGEQSGHIIFGKIESTGDGLVTAIMMMEALIEKGVKASELVRGLTLFPQLTVNVKVKNKREILKRAEVSSEIAEAEKTLDGGRLLVRASGTEEVVRITAECESAEKCKAVCRRIENALRRSDGRGS